MPRAEAATVATLLALALLAPANRVLAQHLPEGGASSCAEFVYDGNTLTVMQDGVNCVIDWESFSIGQGYAVHFAQQSHWRALNRVTGGMFSRIAGTLTADGSIYITNPAGIVFAQGAIVDAGAIYAAAGHMSDADFLSGTDRFTGLAGEVKNKGEIGADAVHLAGRRVVNAGYIRTVGGVATLTAAEDEVLLTEAGGRVLVRVDGTDLNPYASQAGGPAAGGAGVGVVNRGVIDARDGQVVLGVGDMYALAIRNLGRIEARGGTAQLAAVSGTVETVVTNSARLAADELFMSGDELRLDGRIDADVVRFNDPVVIADRVRIRGAEGDRAEVVIFGATVDGAGAGTGDLEIDAASTAFAADVGGASPLGTLDIAGDVDAAGAIRARHGVAVDGAVALSGTGTQAIDAGDGALAVGAVTKNGPGDVVLRSGDRVTIDGDFAAFGGDAVVDAPWAEVNGSVTAMRDTTFTGDATVIGNVIAGDDAEFGGAAVVFGAVQAQDDVRFDADATVGAGVFAGDDVRFRADATVTGPIVAADDVRVDGDALVLGSVSAGDDARFFGAATVTGAISAADDVEVHGAGDVGGNVLAGGDALFSGQVGGDLVSGGDLRIPDGAEVAGDVLVEGALEADSDLAVGGDLVVGDDLSVAGAAWIGGDVDVGVDADFGGRTTVNGDASAGDDLRFHDRVRVRGHAFAADDLRFAGSTRIDGDARAGDDISFESGARVRGSVVSGDDARFRAPVRVDGDVRAADDIEFDGGAVVGGDLRAGDDIRAEGRMHVGGNVVADDNITLAGRTTMTGVGARRIVSRGGMTRVLAALDKRTEGRLVIRGHEGLLIGAPSIRVRDDLVLGGGRTGIPAVATVAVHGSSRLESRSGALRVAAGEKITAFGDLTLTAADRVVIGDVNVLGTLTVTAPSIDLRTRDAGDVLQADGSVVRDAGLDLAAERFLFRVAPGRLGDGGVRFGSPRADADGTGMLTDYRLRVLDGFDAAGWVLDARVLDLAVDGAVATELATAFDERPAIDPVRREDETRRVPRGVQ